MNINWDILTKELALYGIKLKDNKNCSVYYNRQFFDVSIIKVLSNLKKRIKQNGLIFEQLWRDLFVEAFSGKYVGTFTSPMEAKLFISSVKSLFILAEFLETYFDFVDSNLQRTLCQKMKLIANRDYKDFPREIAISIIDFNLSIHWVFVTMKLLVYICDLLRAAMLGPDRISSLNIKIARSISGPWANLDLPMLERVFPYADIAEEMYGRGRDIRQQLRYKKGFEFYNDLYGRSGLYWREMRNEPFSWSDRKDESPYPNRELLMKP